MTKKGHVDENLNSSQKSLSTDNAEDQASSTKKKDIEEVIEDTNDQILEENIDQPKDDSDNIKRADEKPKRSPTKRNKKSDTTTSPRKDSNFGIYALITLAIAIILWWCSNQMTDYDLNKDDWRSEIDPDKILSDDQRHIVHASLKSIMDKSSNKEGVSTLLILSPNEETAVKIAQCLLKSVNTEKHKYEVPTEIDLRSHRGGKLQLDKNLRSLLSPGGSIRAVLLRHIDDQSTSDAFDRTRLLFAYCDGENPVVPHRLIIMTATSTSQDESELRENFKTRWPNEHDYVDALMSRISGHTLFVEKDQKSIC